MTGILQKGLQADIAKGVTAPLGSVRMPVTTIRSISHWAADPTSWRW
jgi:hypothetical protein